MRCVIAALQAVDYVVLFDEATPCELIERVRPDVYVKGGDYDIESAARDRAGAQLGRSRGRDPVRRRLLDHAPGRAHPQS